MGGSVQFHKSANRFYISIYWQGKHHKLFRDYDSFQPFFTKSRAVKYLGILQKQIEDHDFDPRYWKPDSPVSVRKYAQEILSRARAHLPLFSLSPFIFIRDDGKPYTNKNLNHIWREASEKTGSRGIINIRELIADLEKILEKIDSLSLLDQDEGTQMLRDQISHMRKRLSQTVEK